MRLQTKAATISHNIRHILKYQILHNLLNNTKVYVISIRLIVSVYYIKSPKSTPDNGFFSNSFKKA